MKKTIAVIFGGRSAEHDVSIITAHIPIIKSLQVSGQFEVWPIYITKEGVWYADQTMNDLTFFKQPDYLEQLVRSKPIQLSLDKGLKIIWPGWRTKSVKIDIVFPSMHGTYGEDGSLMGLLRLANVPFVGCDMAASAVAMDKALTKQVLQAEGLPVTPYVWFTAADWASKKQALLGKIQALGWPVFVKPVHLGSSIGITKAKTSESLEQAIEVAFHFDNKVLVEKSVEQLIEVTLPIMGNDQLQLAAIERPLNKTEFFNFEDKYLSGGKKGSASAAPYSQVPAQIDDSLATQVRELAQRTYKILGCSGIARVDFLIDETTQQVYVNEVNTLPGSLYEHNWKAAGVSSLELVLKLVQLAEDRFNRDQHITYTFKSEVLQKVGGAKHTS